MITDSQMPLPTQEDQPEYTYSIDAEPFKSRTISCCLKYSGYLLLKYMRWEVVMQELTCPVKHAYEVTVLHHTVKWVLRMWYTAEVCKGQTS